MKEIKQIFVDMDGVLTDFVSAARKENIFDEAGHVMWNKLNVLGTSFWTSMDWNVEGYKLWKALEIFCSNNNIGLCILSQAVNDTARNGKLEWIKENLGISSLRCFFVKNGYEKSRFATSDSLLIDDYRKNLLYFEKRGGTGIQFKDAETAVRKLKTILYGTGLSESIVKKFVVRNGQKVKKAVSTKDGYRVEYDKNHQAKEVRITKKEEKNRKLGQRSGKIKRKATEALSQMRRLRSFKKRAMSGLQHYTGKDGKAIIPEKKPNDG